MANNRKVSDLIGPALNWAVSVFNMPQWSDQTRIDVALNPDAGYSPSTNWDHGGPILEKLLRQGMIIDGSVNKYYETLPPFKATIDGWNNCFRGQSALIVAMQCYVFQYIGHEISIPDELV